MSDKNRLVQQRAEDAVYGLFTARECLRRPVGQHDKGIDADLELTVPIQSQSRYIGLQVKGRTQAKRKKNGNLSETVDWRHVRYWAEYGRPVLFVVFDGKAGEAYWLRVDNITSRHLEIPATQTVSSLTSDDLAALLSAYDLARAFVAPLHASHAIVEDFAKTFGDVPAQLSAKLLIADKQVSEHRYAEAAETYRAVAELFPQARLAKLNLVACLQANRKSTDALRLAEKMVVEHPAFGLAHTTYAFVLALNGRFNEAVTQIDEAIRLDGRTAVNIVTYSLLELWRGDGNQAKAYALESIALEPASHGPRINLALAETLLGDYESALNRYDEAIALRPTYYESHLNKALLLRMMDRHEAALKAYDATIAVDANRFEAYWNSAELLRYLGDGRTAAERYLRSMELRGEDPETHLWLAFSYARAGDPQSAVEHLIAAGHLPREEQQIFFDPGHHDSWVLIVDQDGDTFHVTSEQVPYSIFDFLRSATDEPKFLSAAEWWEKTLTERNELAIVPRPPVISW